MDQRYMPLKAPHVVGCAGTAQNIRFPGMAPAGYTSVWIWMYISPVVHEHGDALALQSYRTISLEIGAGARRIRHPAYAAA
jgi:hypothetical protein